MIDRDQPRRAADGGDTGVGIETTPCRGPGGAGFGDIHDPGSVLNNAGKGARPGRSIANDESSGRRAAVGDGARTVKGTDRHP